MISDDDDEQDASAQGHGMKFPVAEEAAAEGHAIKGHLIDLDEDADDTSGHSASGRF